MEEFGVGIYKYRPKAWYQAKVSMTLITIFFNTRFVDT